MAGIEEGLRAGQQWNIREISRAKRSPVLIRRFAISCGGRDSKNPSLSVLAYQRNLELLKTTGGSSTIVKVLFLAF